MAFIGIDLGTTTSEIAIFRDGTPSVLEDMQGNEIIDSKVGIDPSDRKLKVGPLVSDFVERSPESGVTEIKRKMGENVAIELGGDSYSPAELSSMILTHLKESAEERLDETVDRCVITVPANFPDPARRATRQAGEIAGMTVERIVNEPTAAALAYGHGEDAGGEHVMVYDLGGGTFDVSIVEQMGPVLDVKASSGDPNLGGKDFDRALLDHVKEQLSKKHGVEDIPDGTTAWHTLRRKCEEAKKTLSSQSQAKIDYTLTESVTVERQTFEEIIAPMVEGTEAAIKQALGEAELKAEDISRVILVGGSTRIPYVQRLVERVMGQTPKSDVDPDRAVALGAAAQAAIVKGESDQVIMDVSAQSFGTAIADARTGQMGIYDEIIPTNGKHQKEYSETYATIHEDQESVKFRVYQCEPMTDAERAEIEGEPNEGFTLLAEQEVGMPPGPPGQKLEATYKYTQDGTIDIQLFVPSTGEELSFQTRAELDEEEITASREKVSKAWKDSEYLGDVEALMEAAERELGKEELSEQKKQEVEELLEKLKGALAREEETEIRRLEEELTDLLFELGL
ncbi:Hsp70 family protein [Salinibacter ruber]|uniref:Hsp70 family protein n=1 Tax=Salinibacter ruber TaxID=146919 RepID=UPI0021674894|nr:Hsp70 family protein [Salinibacter ruber]MCS4056825.1 molecular chaperone DnaK [Salinibacter ruber]